MSKFIKKKSERIFLLYTFVKPNSKIQRIIDDGDHLKILLRSKAIQNKANRELLDLLKKKLKPISCQIQIISGVKNENKVIELIFSEPIVEQDIIKKMLG